MKTDKIMIDKCAFNTFTQTYQSPIFAEKKYEYRCPDPSCNEIVFLRKGEKNNAHFCHKKNTGCRRYETAPTESELHKEAKHILRELIVRGYNILFERKCNGCLTNEKCDAKCLKECSKLNENQKVIEEYSMHFNGGKITPDLAIVTNEEEVEEVDEIYEIYKTHRTLETDRPSYLEWYEIKAEEICNKVPTIKDDKKVILDCIRVWQCEECALADEKEKKRLKRLEQDEYNKKCAKKKEEEKEKQLKENEEREKLKLRELNQELRVLANKYDGYVRCKIEDDKLKMDINTFIKMPQEVYSQVVKKHFPKFKYYKDEVLNKAIEVS